MVRVAGAFVSGLGHAGLVGLALVGPPFLWAPRDRPVPAIAVSLLSPGELAALRPPPPSPPSPPTAPPRQAAAPVPMPPPLVPAAPAESEQRAPATTLAPGFGAGALLGEDETSGQAPPVSGDPDTASPAPEAVEPAVEPAVDPEALRVAYAARVQRAVARARVYPQVARDRGLEGRVAFQLVLSREGRLLTSQLLRSSGAMTLDRAALETVRRAAYPPVPADLDGERVPVAVEVVFTGSDR